MASNRRMGPKGSEVWHSMLDAAESILIEEGAVSLNSRSVADVAGVKQRLVYYYFATMDELVVETFRRLAERERGRLERGLESRHSLREMWGVFIDTSDTRLVSEFMALSNRIDALRLEVAEHVKVCRRIQIEAIQRALSARNGAFLVAPAAAALFAASAALTMHREKSIGVDLGHGEALEVISRFLDQLDPGEE